MNIYFKTHGCSTNFSESEVMMGLLEEAGFKIVERPEPADVIIINVCTVKGEFTAVKSIRGTLDEFPGKKFIVAGCLTPALVRDIREMAEDASLINTNNIKKIVEVVEEVVNDNVIEAIAGDMQEAKIGMPKVRINSVAGIVPILSGCSNECSYCSVKLIKGKLVSYPKEDILKEVKDALSLDGCKEIWITSQDNASYNLDKEGILLPDLLKEVLAIDRQFMVRLGMMNPSNVLPILDELIEVYKNNFSYFNPFYIHRSLFLNFI